MKRKSSQGIQLEAHLGYLLRRVSNEVSSTFSRSLQEHNVSVGEWVILCHIQNHPQISSSTFADTLLFTRGAVSKITKKLETKHWVKRTISPEDCRVHQLVLTPRCQKLLPKLAKIADQNDEQFFSCLEDGEQNTLRRIFGKLIRHHQIKTIPIE